MVFGLPKEVDDYFYFQLLVIFLIGFSINVYTNGKATIIWVDEYCSLPEDNVLFNKINEFELDREVYFNTLEAEQKAKLLADIYHETKWKHKFALYFSLILYWIISPLVNFYYAIFVFRTKDLNRRLSLKKNR